jgi:adenine-specific DNA methylase
MHIDKRLKVVEFGIAKSSQIRDVDGTMRDRGNARCPFCEQITPVDEIRKAGISGAMGERIVAVILEGKTGKEYRPVEDTDLAAFQKASQIEVERPSELILPEITAEDVEDDISNSTGIRVHLYGMKTWGSLFNPRQLVAMQTFVECVREAHEEMKQEGWEDDYRQALVVYLGMLLGRIVQRGSNVGIWHTGQETFEHPFGRQAIPMVWDFPEANPFSSFSQKTMSAEYILKVIRRESGAPSLRPLPAKVYLGDAADLHTTVLSDAVVMDPPYFDAIAYGDLSDYFYVWLRRALGDVFPDVFTTPLSPKSDEATSLKHRHNGQERQADSHFKLKLTQSLKRSFEHLRPNGIITIMFAHQSTKAWSALIEAILGSGLTVNATWAIDTEKIYALKSEKSVLASSITVSCSPRITGSAASFKDVRKEIELVVQESVKRFWGYGLRGADLIVACYGPAVGVFGKFDRVEKADGTPVKIPELLELARNAARDAIAGEFKGDNLSTLYYVWANLYGVSEQAWDDARLVVQIGGETEDAMDVARGHGLFVVDGSRCRLALLGDREDRRGLGVDLVPPLIDALHRSMVLWKRERRPDLVSYLNERGLLEDGPFWKLAQALFEVLPRDTEDWKITSTLLGERETLRREGKGPDGMLFRR